jgi:hypothetical protein
MVAGRIEERRVATAPFRNADDPDRPAGASPADDVGFAHGALLIPAPYPVIPAKAGIHSG